ncbi:MAG: DsbA family oxidoreductase [Gemmataceae bacterium]|nr:DsbA family oxidoreductase [Gemmataceae bacterium]
MEKPIMMNPNPACTASGCGDSVHRTTGPAAEASTLTIDVVSDVICPWCYIGKRRLEKALKLLGDPSGVKVIWRPFQLNPQMPAQGIERRAYRTAKFGSWEESQARDAQVAAAGAEEGIMFAFDRITRTPNTLDAHRLIWLAGQRGVQDAVVETLFRGYFEEGLNFNDRAVLIRLAVEGGMPASDVERLLASDEGRADVLREEAHFKALGMSGVPTFFLNGKPAFSGAVAPPMLADAIRQLLPVPESTSGSQTM